VHQKEGASDFMFPKKSIIRFDFPARGNMPPVKLFWHDGWKETPEIPGVPKGEYLGDLPAQSRRGPRRGAAELRRRAPPRTAGPDLSEASSTTKRFQKVLKDPNPRIPKPDGSVLHRRQGNHHHRHLRRDTRLIPVEKMKDYKFPAELLTRSPGHYPTGSAPARAATRPAPISTSPRRLWNGCCSA
jgi:hypothetical protein